MCFEIVLPRPPFVLAVCARGADEPFHSSLGWNFMMSSRFVVAIAVVLSRKADIFCDALGEAALERFCMFPFVFSSSCQRHDFVVEGQSWHTCDLSGS